MLLSQAVVNMINNNIPDNKVPMMDFDLKSLNHRNNNLHQMVLCIHTVEMLIPH